MSGLYFRGKLGYALAFAKPPDGCVGTQVIVPGLGLRAPHDTIDLDGLHAIARVPVDPEEQRYTRPLQRDAARLAERLQATDTAVLLGSIATAKYLDPLKAVLDRKSTRLNSSHVSISYAVFCLKKKKKK